MPLRKTIEVVSKLAAEGVIRQYAVAGAVAALNYIQPTLTEDLDILVSVDDLEERSSGLILLPVASALDEEALSEAAEAEFQSEEAPPIKARILRAEHVVATALKVGRLKDLARVEAFLDQEAVNLAKLKSVLQRHHLMSAWKAFLLKSGKPDLLG